VKKQFSIAFIFVISNCRRMKKKKEKLKLIHNKKTKKPKEVIKKKIKSIEADLKKIVEKIENNLKQKNSSK